MYRYTPKGYEFVEYDPPDIKLRTECRDCGAELPKEPDIEQFVEEWVDEPVTEHHDDGRIVQYTMQVPRRRPPTPEELNRRDPRIEWTQPVWRCSCGKEYGYEEMEIEEWPH